MPSDPIICAVHVTPKSGKDQVVGISTAADGMREVRVRVTAPPDNGKANKAVCKLLASSLGIAKSCVTIKRGETSHHKLLQIECHPQAFDGWLAALPTVQ